LHLSLQKRLAFTISLQSVHGKPGTPYHVGGGGGRISGASSSANNVPNVSNLPEINLSQSHQAGGTRGHQNKPQGKLLG
jgi:hypothetical protein